jgi:hypothetical protein
MIVEGDKLDFFLRKIQRFFTLGLNLTVGRGPPGPPSRSATGPREKAVKPSSQAEIKMIGDAETRSTGVGDNQWWGTGSRRMGVVMEQRCRA